MYLSVINTFPNPEAMDVAPFCVTVKSPTHSLPSGFMDLMPFGWLCVNQRLPSGPVVMYVGPFS